MPFLNKNILIEKNILKNPFDEFFNSMSLDPKNGKIGNTKICGLDFQ